MTPQRNRTILVVDDERDILELLSYVLSQEGFTVETAPDGEEGLRKLRAGNYTLVILDLMLPGIQGIELCRIIRDQPLTKDIPIIIVSAKKEEVDRILGLEMGADDYLTKPFSPKELTARIRTVLRRAHRQNAEPERISIGELVINTDSHSVTKKDVLLNLSPTEFRLLLFLVEQRGKIFSRERLLQEVWKDKGEIEPRTVDVHISRVRTLLEDDPTNPVYIRTRRGSGYYLSDPVPKPDNR